MKAITVEPHKPQSERREDVPEPDIRGGSVLLQAIAVGVCGTDAEIVGTCVPVDFRPFSCSGCTGSTMHKRYLDRCVWVSGGKLGPRFGVFTVSRCRRIYL